MAIARDDKRLAESNNRVDNVSDNNNGTVKLNNQLAEMQTIQYSECRE